MDLTNGTTQFDRRKLLLAYSVAALFTLCLSFVAFIIYPSERLHWQRLLLYVSGIVTLLASTLIFAFLTWHWILRPLPAHRQTARGLLGPGLRRMVAGALTITNVALFVGGYWDVCWHLMVPASFGDDFWWRPHQLIYVGILSPSVAAIGLLAYAVIGHGGSSLRNLRGDPTIALLVAAGGFSIFSAMGDPTWHALYGRDISAWSPPHMIVMFAYLLNMLAIIAVHLSSSSPDHWRLVPSIETLTRNLPVLCVVAVFLPVIWLNQGATPYFTDLVLSRLSWLYPVLICVWAGFMGTVCLHAVRFPGAATCAGLAAWILGLGLLKVFPGAGTVADLSLAALLPLIALDIWYGYHLKTKSRPPSWIGGGIAVAVGGLASFFLPATFFQYLRFGSGDIPVVSILGVCAAVIACWEAQIITEFLHALAAPTQTVNVHSRWVGWTLAGVVIGLLLFLYFFITTAIPPV